MKTVTVSNPVHSFRTVHMSRSARQAAKAAGMASVGVYEILSHVRITCDEDLAELGDIIVIRAFSKEGRKSADITAGEVYFYETEYTDAPMARIAR